ncbi:MAG: amidohydrolase family protein [Acidobacteria bacterium]|nr:amidohydrolase family protein [Acidobacteriota bacterium]
MIRRASVAVVACTIVIAAWASLSAQSASWAIQNARIVPVSGAVIEKGTVVMRDGVIAAVGASVTTPTGAQVIDGAGLTVYPGLIDMGSTAGLALPPAPRAESPRTTEDVERVKADYLRRAHFRAADVTNPASADLSRAAAEGITAVLATPNGDGIRGQSALIMTALQADQPQIGAVADPRKGPLVLSTPVALHVTFSERPAGGSAYPNSLMGVIAFVRQTLLDGQHYGRVAAGEGGAPYDPALEALQPALGGRMPVAFQANSAAEIIRALDMAKQFSLQPIITGGFEADRVATDLKTANARVILSLDWPTRSESLAPDDDEPLAAVRLRAQAPAVAAALAKAQVPFAFASAGLSKPDDFRLHAARVVARGLAADRALAALTIDAARMAGVENRLGTIETGKAASLVITRGDLFDEKATIAHVFVAGEKIK